MRDVLALAGGTTVAQLLLIFASPLLTRLYTPVDFGLLAVFSSFLSILSVVVSLRYEFAIPIAQTNDEAKNLLVLSLLLVGIFSLAVAVVVLFWGPYLAAWSNTPQLTPLLWFLPAGLAVFGMLQATSYWYIRIKKFSQLGIVKTLQSASQITFQLLAGLSSLGAIGLITGQILGRCMSILYLLPKHKDIIRAISFKNMYFVAKRYSKFPLYTSAASLINILGTQAPAIMFAKLFSPEIAGYFSLTVRILGLPSALVGQAIGQAIYPRMAEKTRVEGGASELIGDVAMVLLLIAFPVFVFVGAYGPYLFSLIFGANWREAGVYATYLSPWLLLAFLSSPLSMYVFVKEKQGQAFLFTLYETTMRIGSIWIGKLLGSSSWAIMLYSFAGFIISGVYLLWIFHLSNTSILKWIMQKKEYFFSAFLVLLTVMILSRNVGLSSMIASLFLLSIHFWYAFRRYGGMLYAR